MKSNALSQNRPNSFKINIENYRTVQNIKNTDTSSIYKIIDIKSEQVFAAKVMKDEKSGEKKTINREIGMMMVFQHPTIIKFYGYSPIDFEKNHNATLIMDFASKGSLYDILNGVQNGFADGNYSNTARQIILTGVARGMMFLHQHHVIHRDLKTSNILLDEQLRPHITDFGLSKTIDSGEELFQSRPHGDVYYMAPELLKCQRYNGKVDVYSYGIIMYEVLTDTSPYPEYKNKKDVMYHYELRDKIMKENYRPQFTVAIKKSFRRLIERCWSKDPNERPTFEEIFNKLAFNIDNSIYDIYDTTDEEDNQNIEIEEDENKYYLEGVDVDEFLNYIDEITEGENTQENDPLLEAIDDLKKENAELRKQINVFTDKISELNKSAAAMQKEFNDKMNLQAQINEKNLEKLKNFKKEIKSLKKRLQPKEKDNISALLVDLTKYKKLKQIGHHSQGKYTVYKAPSQNSDNETVAIKVFRDDHTKVEKELFINDIKMRVSLQNIAILPLIGYSLPEKDDESYSIISPYMVNGDLHQFITKIAKGKDKVTVNWETIRAINIFGIATGMVYLHSKNIICKNLDSSSILLNENYHPKINRINFLSLPENTLSEFKRPIFIAPEIYLNTDLSNKVDVYSYAFILYELFTLKIPKVEDFPVKPDKRPSLSIDAIPPKYRELIESCWNQDPRLRPTFEQIVQDFIQNSESYFKGGNIDEKILQKYIEAASEGIEIPK